MTAERILSAEGFTNIIAGAGLWYYLVTILMNRTRSTLERRLSLLLGVVGTLFLVRGVSYTTGFTKELAPYVFGLSLLFPLACVLFCEALLRRHVPLALKILTVGGLALLLPFAFAEVKNPAFYVGLFVYQGVVLACLAYLTICRDKQSLSEAENRLINGVAMACAIATPLLMSDYRFIFKWDIMRLGALGGLVFALSTIKFSEKSSKREVAREFLHIILTDVLGTMLFCLIWNEFDSFFVAYPVFMTMHLLILILKDLTHLEETRMQKWIFPIVDAIEKRQVHSVSDLHKLLHQQLGKTSVTFLSEDSMWEYDIDAIKDYLQSDKPLSLSALRRDPSAAAVELTYALESHQMNHIHVVSLNPVLMIFTNTPSYKGAAAYEKEMKILKSFIALLQRGEA